MATINLVTGYTGEAHIKSEEDALFNSLVLSNTNAIIALTNTFGNTSCNINCDCVLEGRLIRTDGNVTLTFTKPSMGYYRYDGIYIVYKKNLSGIESAELVYCQGAENSAQATAQQNIGQPTIDADVTDSASLQLFTVAWDNSQTKTVVQNVLLNNTRFDIQNDKTNTNFVGNTELINGIAYINGLIVIKNTINSGGIVNSIPTVWRPIAGTIRTSGTTVNGKPFIIIFYEYANMVDIELVIPSGVTLNTNDQIFFSVSYPCAGV